jgi:uncharacterized protein (UPF0276 family)
MVHERETSHIGSIFPHRGSGRQHGVGLSLGTVTGLDPQHVKRFKTLINRFEPFLVSEHLSFSVADGIYLNDLLPLPYTEETLDIVAENVSAAQDAFGRQVLIENPSRYLAFRHSTIPEAEFLGELARRTGCGILLDVNNIFVTCTNLALDAGKYLDALSDSEYVVAPRVVDAFQRFGEPRNLGPKSL